MKILFIGDIVGRNGREAVKKTLPALKKNEGIHVVIANAENAAHGKGVTSEIVKELQEAGVQFFTSGNHIWSIKEAVHKLNNASFPVIRPANYPEGNPGRGYDIIETVLLKKVLVINLQGRVFMPEGLDNPFKKVDEILKLYEKDNSISAIVVDFHAEATSEKHAMRHYVDGRVSALFGTHSHVATNDVRVSDKGTAYITDVGMTGVYWDSVIGINKQDSLNLFLLGNTPTWEPAEGEKVFNAVLLDVDDTTRKSISLKIIQEIIP